MRSTPANVVEAHERLKGWSGKCCRSWAAADENGDDVRDPRPCLRPLLDAASPAQELARLFTYVGHECYLVGGTLRGGRRSGPP